MLALAAGHIWPKLPPMLPPALSPDGPTQVLFSLLRGQC